MTEKGMYLDAKRLIVGFLILIIALYTDIKTRRASKILYTANRRRK